MSKKVKSISEIKDMIKDKKLEAGNLMTAQQLKDSNLAIHSASVLSGLSGAIPIPVADALPISATQITMVIALGKIFDQEITQSAAKAIISAAAATFAGRQLVKMIPVVGWGISAAVASVVTEAIGWMVAVDMAKNSRKEWERQKAVVEAADKYADEAFDNETDFENDEAEDFSEDTPEV